MAEVGVDPGAAGQTLSHVFSLLSLVLPREPLQIAFQGLQSSDRQLRGTALEYLEGVLPSAIRAGLWPLLVRRPAARLVSSRGASLLNASALARSHRPRRPLNDVPVPAACRPRRCGFFPSLTRYQQTSK